MSSEERPFVDYYSKNNISPVSQNISDLNTHFTRRNALYRHLGIPPILLKGKRIIEIGPGSGHNALFTLSCEPSTYDFVEGNPVGAKDTLERVTAYQIEKELDTKINMYQILLEDFVPDEKYDVIFCEGLLPLQKNPAQMLRHIVNFAKANGIVVITCADAVSLLSDNIRRIMGQMLINNNLELQEMAIDLTPFFETHFKNLHGMSRPIKDWILDNVLQPFYGKLFSIADACSAIADIAYVYNSSQSFYQDWKWYKNIDFSTQNNDFIKCWKMNIHNFLDYRYTFTPFDEKYNMELYAMCEEFAYSIYSYQRDKPEKINEILSLLNNICTHINQKKSLGEIQLCLRDAHNALLQIRDGEKQPDCGSFTHFFGRGQQYLSFLT